MDIRRVCALGAAVLIAAGLMTGCGSTAAPSPVSSTSTTPRPLVTASTSPADAAKGASEIAVKAMLAFTDHKRAQDVWWADFSQYLSPDAAYVWEGTRAVRVPASSVTGEPVTSVNSGTSVSVLVPTDAGQYRLDMIRRVEVGATGGPWLVFAMTLPAASS